MIYIDPPYGIRFASNFQPEVGNRQVRDADADLTREPETVRAYRDTWHLGVHSYLSYLRDRLVAARDLLSDAGSLFLQIGDENLHRVRALLDEVFGSENAIALIAFKKTEGGADPLVRGRPSGRPSGVAQNPIAGRGRPAQVRRPTPLNR
jgi:adenine-specific DNA-methyltransferase